MTPLRHSPPSEGSGGQVDEVCFRSRRSSSWRRGKFGNFSLSNLALQKSWARGWLKIKRKTNSSLSLSVYFSLWQWLIVQGRLPSSCKVDWHPSLYQTNRKGTLWSLTLTTCTHIHCAAYSFNLIFEKRAWIDGWHRKFDRQTGFHQRGSAAAAADQQKWIDSRSRFLDLGPAFFLFYHHQPKMCLLHTAMAWLIDFLILTPGIGSPQWSSTKRKHWQ